MKTVYRPWVWLGLPVIAFLIVGYVRYWPKSLKVEAVGIFDDDKLTTGGGTDTSSPLAHLAIDIRPPAPVFGSADHIDRVVLYGTPGVKSPALLALPEFRIGDMSAADLYSPQSVFKLGPTGAWVDVVWDTKKTDYSLLVRVTHSAAGSPGSSAGYQDVPIAFTKIVQTKWVPGTRADPGHGQNHAQVTATGSFFGGQNLAVYNVSVHYTPPMPGSLTSITVLHGPKGGALTYLGGMYTPTSAEGIWAKTLRGYYDGSSSYVLHFECVFSDGVEVYDYAFDNLTSGMLNVGN
jgi:hypothetical protein